MKKNLLLICWDFPPNYGIAGRRWAKFAKTLAKKGYTVYVIKSRPSKGNKESAWTQDVGIPGINTYELVPYWANRWLNDYSSLFSPLKIRLAQLYLKSFFKGTIYDKAIGVEKHFKALCTKLINTHNIKNVMVTGAPFNLMYYTTKLKSVFPDLNIIADYRDPWMDLRSFGMDHLNQKRKLQELEKQQFVFENADVITGPNNFLLEQLRAHSLASEKIKARFFELEHFFDTDEIPVTIKAEKEADSFKILYAGALYPDSDRYLIELARAIKKFKEKAPDINIELHIFTDQKTNVFNDPYVASSVKFFEPVGNKIFEKIYNYDFMVILLSSYNKDFKTTKFFEFLPYKTPYLYVGPEGFVSQSIEKDGWGYALHNDNDLVTIFNNKNDPKKLKGFETINNHSLNTIAEKLTSLFI